MRSSLHPALIFAAIFVVIFLLHAPLLRLPYFWDEAGYYVPAARDLLLHGSLIPHTTVSNAHPPLVMAWLALWWKVVGYAPAVTRAAMLVFAAFSLLGVFRLAEVVTGDKLEGNHLTDGPSMKIGSARISTSISPALSDIRLASTGKRR